MTRYEALVNAHDRAGAPGSVVNIVDYGDGERGRGHYSVTSKHIFEWQQLPDGRVRVWCNWTVGGCQQRKQATSEKEKANV